MLGFRRSRAAVGLDIGSSAIKAVELKSTGKGLSVRAIATEPVPVGSIVNGAIVDGGAVAGAIRRLFERTRFSTTDVVASLSGSAVIVKKITLPAMTGDELAGSIHWEAEQHIPFDIQDVCIDYQVLEPTTPTTAKGSIDVLLVAAKREKIADYTSVIKQAGRMPVVVDIDAFALQNAFDANYDGGDAGTVVILLNAGASTINLTIVGDGQALFTRDISMGGNAYTEAVQRDLGLSFQDADRAKRGETVGGVDPDDVRPVLGVVTDAVLLEIEKTFDFFRATAASDRFQRILLTGGASLVDGFDRALEARFGEPVEAFNPFKNIGFNPAALGIEDLSGLVPASAVAVGLALRRGGDR